MKTYCYICNIHTKVKERHYCKDCRKSLCWKHIYSPVVDDTNRAIMKNCGMVCMECYTIRKQNKSQTL